MRNGNRNAIAKNKNFSRKRKEENFNEEIIVSIHVTTQCRKMGLGE